MFGQVCNKDNDLAELLRYEWIETNGIGGWSSSTIIGTNTRKYHSLLMSALSSPVNRQTVVSGLDETVLIDGKTYNLSTNIYPNAVQPEGYRNFYKFEKRIFPEFLFHVAGIKIKKTISCIYGENTVIVSYKFFDNSNPVEFEIKPFLSSRYYHSLQNSINTTDYSIDHFDNILLLKKANEEQAVYIKTTDAEFINSPDIYYNFEFPEERNRGLDFRENLFTPGTFKSNIKPNSEICFLISTEDPYLKVPSELVLLETRRRNNLVNKTMPVTDVWNVLLLAADQFIVRKDKQLKTIIAGYHWFGDWGRDTMISLPGLTLATKRYADAKKILKAFTNYIDMGMLPNRFPDEAEKPEYNTVDATLWFFIAIYYFYLETKDKKFVLEYLYPKLKDIIEWHEKGTRYNIHEDTDGLLYSGEDGVQLTWMDAKVDNWVVTPRTGKAVEINTLWYNAIKIMEFLSEEIGNSDSVDNYNKKSKATKKSFNKQFWNEKGNYLFDYINNDYKDPSVRPNQLFALSLPFPLITKVKGKKIMNLIEKELLTPYGLRSLSPVDPNYKMVYQGNQYSRDGAYHQGTVWSWLIGAYADALYYVYGDKAQNKIQKIFTNIIPHLSKACIGTVSEIFDGESPHNAKGAVAQAWSVAELLRIYKKYNGTK